MLVFPGMPGKPPNLFDDLKRAVKAAAKLGMVLAILCHVLPPHYRPICDAVAKLCTGGN